MGAGGQSTSYFRETLLRTKGIYDFFFKVLRNSGELYAMGFYVTPGTCGARYLIGPQIYTETTKGRSFKAITQLLNYLSQRRKKGATGGHGLISERVVMVSHLKSL